MSKSLENCLLKNKYFKEADRNKMVELSEQFQSEGLSKEEADFKAVRETIMQVIQGANVIYDALGLKPMDLSGYDEVEMPEMKPIEATKAEDKKEVAPEVKEEPKKPNPPTEKEVEELLSNEEVDKLLSDIDADLEALSPKVGFTEAKDMNRMFADLKTKYGDKKGSQIYEAAERLVSPNKNTIVEIRSNGVVVKEGDKYIFNPFGNTDANTKNWTLYKGVDITEQFENKGIDQQIENFGVNKADVGAVSDVISQVFKGLKEAGLTAAKTVGDWIDIGKGVESEESLFKNEDVINGFYSPLEKIISETKLDKLPIKQWIDKFAKGEEAKWTGLSDWLAQQSGSVSKADILKYLKDNRVEIKEVVKSDALDESMFRAEMTARS